MFHSRTVARHLEVGQIFTCLVYVKIMSVDREMFKIQKNHKTVEI